MAQVVEYARGFWVATGCFLEKKDGWNRRTAELYAELWVGKQEDEDQYQRGYDAGYDDGQNEALDKED